ncbi:uncharacterized protein PWA37_002777 [Arxiozyma heterogenica]|uniref:Uncharacterized protein n=1 Tax=Arxiozyma heterogenica TaxID=278026 RepID=A0AAN7W2A6_9SACH|nr:hypothetical protein RI543_003493 [Kazachstania heterogenica]
MDGKNTSERSTFTLHFVPCKTDNNTKTTEFNDLLTDKDLNDKYLSIYIQGRNLLGKEILNDTLQPYLISTNSIIEDDQNQKQIIETNKLKKLNKVINYEREGNEERLKQEHDKLSEYIILTNIIHGK